MNTSSPEERLKEEKLNAARARLAELANKFLTRSEADIATMRHGLTRLAEGHAEAVGEVRHLAHRMVGTGATLGFESLSARALRIEQLTETCAPGALPDAAARGQLGDALDALSAEFRQQRGS